MSLLNDIKNYKPTNEQEEHDKEIMLTFMQNNDDYLSRENKIAHFTASIWTVNKKRTKTLMVYHNIYDSWSWIGGHADGDEDLAAVALRELQEETGVRNAKLVSNDIFSLEILTVSGHMKKGIYVPGHLHFNVTYLAEADEEETLVVNADENQAVKWWTFEEALKMSTEPWMVEWIYKKLIEKSQNVILRVQKMEGYLDEIVKSMENGFSPDFIKEDKRLQGMLSELTNYYENGQWLKDYECDERGELPADLKRGVLAEDTLYNFFCEMRRSCL